MKILIVSICFLFVSMMLFGQELNFDSCKCKKDISKNISFVEKVMRNPEKLRDIVSEDSSFLSNFYREHPFDENRQYDNPKYHNFYERFLYFTNKYFIDGYTINECECLEKITTELHNIESRKLFNYISISSNSNGKIQIIFKFEFDVIIYIWKFNTVMIDDGNPLLVPPIEIGPDRIK